MKRVLFLIIAAFSACQASAQGLPITSSVFQVSKITKVETFRGMEVGYEVVTNYATGEDTKYCTFALKTSNDIEVCRSISAEALQDLICVLEFIEEDAPYAPSEKYLYTWEALESFDEHAPLKVVAQYNSYNINWDIGFILADINEGQRWIVERHREKFMQTLKDILAIITQ